MSYLLLGAIVVICVMMFGGRLLRRPTWRIGSAMGALFAFAGAGYAALSKHWPIAIVLVVMGLWLATSARFPREAQRAKPAPATDRSRMSLSEARSMLGVAESASREDIQAAYSRLMKRVHPDHGGAAGLAAQLNAARDRLLKG